MTVLLGLVVAMLGTLIAHSPVASAADDPPKPVDVLSGDLKDMSDDQVASALAQMAPKVAEAWKDEKFQRSVPEDQREAMGKFFDSIQTKDGRYSVIPDLRKIRETQDKLPQPPEQSLDATVAEATGLPASATRAEPVRSVRSGAPAKSTSTSFPVAAGSGACDAPNGVGTETAPASTRPGQLLTPAHDVYTKLSPGIQVNGPMTMSPSGVEPVPGQGPGITFGRGLTVFQQSVLVRVDLESVPNKQLPVRALIPLISIKPIGGGPADEHLIQYSQMRNVKVYCYANDTRSDRGYFEAYVPVGGVEPGFQVIAEVVDNDWYFQNVAYDLLLAQAGPQFFAGADRATVHASESDTVTTAANAFPNAAGAFATSAPDPAGGVSNVLTETNGIRNDDIEAPLAAIVDSTIRDKVSSTLSDDLLQWYAVTVTGSVVGQYQPQVDLRYAPLHDGSLDPSDEPAGPTGALRADISVNDLKIDLFSQLLGAGCVGLGVILDVGAQGKVWADPVGNGITIDPKVNVSTSYSDDFTWTWGARFNPICWLTAGLGKALAGYFVESAISDGVKEAFDYDDHGNPGAVQKIFDGMDLNSILPTINLGSAAIRPVMSNIDNGWCGSSAGFAGCDPNSDLFDQNGIGVSGDGTVIGSLSDALGNPLVGKFRNVFHPSTFSTVEDLVTSHRDANGVSAGLGAVVDPVLVNLAMRHLTTGSRTDGTTNGLLDLQNVTVPVLNQSVSAKPEVAPMVIGQPKPPPVLTQTARTVETGTVETGTVEKGTVEKGAVGTGTADKGTVDGTVERSTTQTAAATPPTTATPEKATQTATATAIFIPPSVGTVPVALPDTRIDLVTAPGTPPIQFSAAAATKVGVTMDPATGGLKAIFDPTVFDLQVTSGCQADYVNAYATSYLLCGRGYNGNGGASTLTGLTDLIAAQVVGPLLSDTIGAIKLPDLDGIVPGMHVALTNVRLAQRGSLLAFYADLRPTPRLNVSTAGGTTSTGTLTIHALTGDFPSTAPITFAWKVTDEVTGHTVPFQGSGNTITVSMSQFKLGETDFGRAKEVGIEVTATQGAFSITAYGGHAWWPPGGDGGGGGGGGCAVACPDGP